VRTRHIQIRLTTTSNFFRLDNQYFIYVIVPKKKTKITYQNVGILTKDSAIPAESYFLKNLMVILISPSKYSVSFPLRSHHNLKHINKMPPQPLPPAEKPPVGDWHVCSDPWRVIARCRPDISVRSNVEDDHEEDTGPVCSLMKA
jgi:hypothetical protein